MLLRTLELLGLLPYVSFTIEKGANANHDLETSALDDAVLVLSLSGRRDIDVLPLIYIGIHHPDFRPRHVQDKQTGIEMPHHARIRSCIIYRGLGLLLSCGRLAC